MAPNEPSASWSLTRECEAPDEKSVGQTIRRSNASGAKVHGQFGAAGAAPWPTRSGYVRYDNLTTPATDRLYLTLRYSKYSSPAVPILIYLDGEPRPRASFYPQDQGDWNRFASTEPLLLGSVGAGAHSIVFFTDGQQYGVADLDQFVLSAGLP